MSDEAVLDVRGNPGEYDFAASIKAVSPCPVRNVAAVIVSYNRPQELAETVVAIHAQTFQPRILVVDSSEDDTVLYHLWLPDGSLRLRSEINLGGAGGYALGLMHALAAGAEWIWLMDDDGRPEDLNTLAALLEEAESAGLDAIAPIVIDPIEPGRFAFPYPVDGRYVFQRDGLNGCTYIPSMAHLFNGLLIRSAAIFKVGLPDLRMFIRGDEVDFLLRMRRAGLRFGTTTKAVFLHPSSNAELHPVFGGRLHVVYPLCSWKRRCQYRNRAYNDIRHRRFLLLFIDLLRYPYFFLMVRKGDLAGLSEWLRASWAGWRGHIHPETAVRQPSPSMKIAGR